MNCNEQRYTNLLKRAVEQSWRMNQEKIGRDENMGRRRMDSVTNYAEN